MIGTIYRRPYNSSLCGNILDYNLRTLRLVNFVARVPLGDRRNKRVDLGLTPLLT